MARDWTKFILSDQDTMLTSKIKLIWPSLFHMTVPRGEKDQSKARYNTSILVPKGHDMGILVARVNDIIAENLTEKQRKETKVKKPFIKVEDQPKVIAMLEKAEIDPADFQCLLRVAAKFKPIVLAANKDPVEDEEQVYSGRWACCSIRPYWWKHDTGGCGVSVGLGNVQLLDHDDALSGGRVDANKEFEAVGDSGGAGAASVFD